MGVRMLLGDLAHRGARCGPRVSPSPAGPAADVRRAGRAGQRLSAVFAAGGVRPGRRVALLTVNTPEALETAFAASRLGACVVPLNPRLAPAEIRFQIEDAGAAYAVVHPPGALARDSGLLGSPTG